MKLRAPTAGDRTLLEQALRGDLSIGKTVVDRGEWRVHDGDVVVNGDWPNDDSIIVLGSVTVSGFYDDYRSGNIGQLVVLGDLAAADIYTWGDLIVTGDVRTRGLLLAVYNDFVTRVGGRVHARGIIRDDKDCLTPRGDVAFQHGVEEPQDARDADTMFRILRPECFTNPGAPFFHGGPNDWSASSGLDPDPDYIRGLLAAHRSPFRAADGPDGLSVWVRECVTAATSPTRLAELAAIDALLAQVIATREDLPRSLIDSLVARDDEIVDANIARHRPSALAGKRASSAMTAALAGVLAQRLDTPEETLVEMAHHPDVAVRRTLIWRSFDLPALSDDVVNALALVDDPRSAAEVIERFRSDLPDETIARLVTRGETTTMRALAGAGLTVEETEDCAPHWDDDARRRFAVALRDTVHGDGRLRQRRPPTAARARPQPKTWRASAAEARGAFATLLGYRR